MKEKESLHQWHETYRIEENGVSFFVKKYKPNSYEIKNELSWLLSNMIRACQSFRVPRVIESSVDAGMVKMEYIDVTDQKTAQESLDYLLEAAAELHSLISSDSPRLRTTGITQENYPQYVKGFARERLDSLQSSEFKLPEEIYRWILDNTQRIRTRFFSVVHRDLRARHLLFSGEEKNPALIDWEFTNISDPSQDLAKIVYDATIMGGLNKDEVVQYVASSYGQAVQLSSDEIEERIRIFLPILPLEH
jgi:aminoglycoside phosphotransferase (APT) family kinase protein